MRRSTRLICSGGERGSRRPDDGRSKCSLIVSDLVIMGNWDQVTADISKHPRAHEKHIQYGTAGFRTKAELLDHVMYR